MARTITCTRYQMAVATPTATMTPTMALSTTMATNDRALVVAGTATARRGPTKISLTFLPGSPTVYRSPPNDNPKAIAAWQPGVTMSTLLK